MIYISTSCIRASKIDEAVKKLVSHSFTNIELSGGTSYNKNILPSLKSLKEEFNVNFMVHNYFPPPQEHFVLNMASLNDDIYSKSMEHYKRAIELSAELGAKAYGMHAGFFINIGTDQLGKRIRKSELFDREQAIERFCAGFNELKQFSGEIALYLENNVFSDANSQEYQEAIPFMLTSYADYIELKEMIDFNLLLDVAHLKVSAHTLGLDFGDELAKMSKHSDYWHLSDNNQLADENKSIGSNFLTTLKELPTRPKQATIEVYEGIESIANNYSAINETLF
jgi:sugar phosphate isomerase/epimerase